jgi:hypothetical protein
VQNRVLYPNPKSAEQGTASLAEGQIAQLVTLLFSFRPTWRKRCLPDAA